MNPEPCRHYPYLAEDGDVACAYCPMVWVPARSEHDPSHENPKGDAPEPDYYTKAEADERLRTLLDILRWMSDSSGHFDRIHEAARRFLP